MVVMAGAGAALVVLAEDDRATRESVSLALELEGYRVTAVADGLPALAAVGAEEPSLLILDVTMPYLDGLSTCRKLRAQGNRTPVLMLTARTEIADRVAGLDAGADDYLVKPFALEELLARVRALVRRAGAGAAGEGSLEVGDLRIAVEARQAWRGRRELELTKTEFDLLELLARNAGIVLTHSTIYDRIWGYDFGSDSKNLAVYVGYLRRKLEEGGEARLIQTVRGVGYALRPG
jgi:two-component system response regulator MprA